MSRRGQVLFLVMSVIWGIPYLLIRVAVRELPPPVLVFARTAPAALLLLPLALRRGYLRPLLARWRIVVVFSLVELAGPWLLLSHAEKRLPSSVSGLLVASVPLIGAVVALAVGHEDRVDRRRLIGLLLGLAGVAGLVGVDLAGTDLLAVGEVGITALGYSIGPLIVSRRFADVPALGVVAAAMGLTAIGYAPVALTMLPARVSGEVIGAVAVLAVVCTAAAFLLFFALIAEVGPARATVITYLNPAVAVILGVSLLGEPLTTGILIGFPLIIAGSVLATGRSRSPSPASPASPAAPAPAAAA
ncbi:MAG: DMT family transporter [Actinomycetota bacterium]|nr:DMT family transporter [Actinomycetota bacterium]